jgi:hypothetical protein
MHIEFSWEIALKTAISVTEEETGIILRMMDFKEVSCEGGRWTEMIQDLCPITT